MTASRGRGSGAARRPSIPSTTCNQLRAAEALAALRDLRTLTYPVIELAAEIWELCDTLSADDAAYLALARRLDTGLVTLDVGLGVVAAAEGRVVQLEIS